MLKIKIALLTLIISFNAFALEKPKSTQTDNTLEVWTGIGAQDDDSTWAIVFTITENRYLIDYPSLDCGGKLVPILISNGLYQFKEKLRYGHSYCLDNGSVEITKTGEKSANFYYSHPEGTARGELVRKK